MWCTTYFDTLNRLGVDHQCVWETDGQSDRQTADGQNHDSNSMHLTTSATNSSGIIWKKRWKVRVSRQTAADSKHGMRQQRMDKIHAQLSLRQHDIIVQPRCR